MYELEGDIVSRYFACYNFLSYQKLINELLNITIRSASDKLEYTHKLMLLSIIVIECVNIFVILIIFPVYYCIQIRRQKILKLVCTFNPILLQIQIEKYKIIQFNRIFYTEILKY